LLMAMCMDRKDISIDCFGISKLLKNFGLYHIKKQQVA
jgi:hypothetical protein